MTFEEICQLEPSFLPLLEDAKKQRMTLKSYRQRNHYWYSVLKPQMYRLVGFGSKHADSRLHTCAAYDIAYEELCSALTGEYIVADSKKGDSNA